MRTVFFARVIGATGGFQPSVFPTPNPYNPQRNTCTVARLAQGQYRLTFGQTMPVTEYTYVIYPENSLSFTFIVPAYLVNNNVVDIFMGDAAILQDVNWWVCIEEIGSLSLS